MLVLQTSTFGIFASKITGLKLGKNAPIPLLSFFLHPTLPTEWPGSVPKKTVTNSSVVKGKENYYSKCNSSANHNSLLDQPTTDSPNFTPTFIRIFYKSLNALEQIPHKILLAVGRWTTLSLASVALYKLLFLSGVPWFTRLISTGLTLPLRCVFPSQLPFLTLR